ncbi:hypothetical protein U5903_10395 [Cereibacter johrii]|uniref:hypothetical protein n=1 Tax=Cereibacter johrii TaxID=445629 RepID=UPI002B25B359|nr:hypothetical protein [Cereibacter johrii]MEA5161181.1 hypothetical protein [Cereibacter johrii]
MPLRAVGLRPARRDGRRRRFCVPTPMLSMKLPAASPRSCMDCSMLWDIIGLQTFSSK